MRESEIQSDIAALHLVSLVPAINRGTTGTLPFIALILCRLEISLLFERGHRIPNLLARAGCIPISNAQVRTMTAVITDFWTRKISWHR